MNRLMQLVKKLFEINIFYVTIRRTTGRTY